MVQYHLRKENVDRFPRHIQKPQRVGSWSVQLKHSKTTGTLNQIKHFVGKTDGHSSFLG